MQIQYLLLLQCACMFAVYQMGPRSWKPDASLAASVPSDQAEPIQRETCIMTESVLKPSESDLVDHDARSNELIIDDKRSKSRTRSPGASQFKAPGVGKETQAANNVADNVLRSNAKKTGQPHVAPGVPSSTADNTGRFGPWAVNGTEFDPSLDDMSPEHSSAMSFSLTGGVSVKRESDRYLVICFDTLMNCIITISLPYVREMCHSLAVFAVKCMCRNDRAHVSHVAMTVPT